MLLALSIICAASAALSGPLMRQWPDLYKWKWMIDEFGLRRATLIRSTLMGVASLGFLVAHLAQS
jgi:hypothetical protein